MAGEFRVDISVLGDKELSAKLNRLAGKRAKSIVRSALRKAAKRTKSRIVQNLSGSPVGVVTGRTRAAFAATKIGAVRNRALIIQGVKLPTREALGIPSGDRNYYPNAIEYGHVGAPAKPFIRPAVDSNKDSEIRAIGKDIGAGLEREAKRK